MNTTQKNATSQQQQQQKGSDVGSQQKSQQAGKFDENKNKPAAQKNDAWSNNKQ